MLARLQEPWSLASMCRQGDSAFYGSCLARTRQWSAWGQKHVRRWELEECDLRQPLVRVSNQPALTHRCRRLCRRYTVRNLRLVLTRSWAASNRCRYSFRNVGRAKCLSPSLQNGKDIWLRSSGFSSLFSEWSHSPDPVGLTSWTDKRDSRCRRAGGAPPLQPHTMR